MFTRERHRKTVQYFGPYSSAKKVRETLDVLNRVFPYRPCEGPTPGRRSGVPVPRLPHRPVRGPVRRATSPPRSTAPLIDAVVEFLSGRVRPLERRLEKAMKDASAAHEFEDAARYRNRLMAVRHLSERQVADRRSMGSADILGVACGEDTANVQLFHLRDGRLSDRHGFYLENAAGRSESDVLWGFALEYYGGQVAIPGQVVVPRGFEDADLLRALHVRPARLGRRGALGTARREAAAGRHGGPERAPGARARHDPARAHARSPDRGDGGAARAAQPRVAADADRVLRRLEPG